jgi:hypothetical protein
MVQNFSQIMIQTTRIGAAAKPTRTQVKAEKIKQIH